MGSIGSKYPKSPFSISRKLSHRLHELTELEVREEAKEAYPKDELRWLKFGLISFITCSGAIKFVEFILEKKLFFERYARFYATLSNTQGRRHELFFLSTIHSVALTAWSVYKLFIEKKPSAWGNYEAMCASLGYFAADTLFSWRSWHSHPAELFHHAIALVSFSAGIWEQFGIHLFPVFLLPEASTPFLNVMWMMREIGYDGRLPGFYRNMKLSFVVLFYATRIIWLPYVTYKLRKYREKDSRISMFVRMMYVGLTLQFYWGFLIAKMALIGD